MKKEQKRRIRKSIGKVTALLLAASIAGSPLTGSFPVTAWAVDLENNDAITVSEIEPVYYTGREITPAVTVFDQGTVLIEDVDYTLTYQNNIDKGIASVTITGMGNYTGTCTQTFRIIDEYEEDETIYGDINGDGQADIADALLISRCDAGLTEFDEEQLRVGDVNSDREVNIADALVISRMDAGLIEKLPRLYPLKLKAEWQQDQVFTLADPAPWNLEELKQVVDVNDPRSVAAYWVWAVNRLTDNYEEGMAMMKYLFADIEVYGSGYTEGGMSGQAGWDSYFDERLTDPDYRWLPRAYFDGGTEENGFKPDRPLTLELYYNSPNTETINKQTLEPYYRLNIVYWVQSYAGGNQVNINLSRFDGTNRWYVTSGTSSVALFYQQPANELAQGIPNDDSTQEEHDAFYQTKTPDE